MKKIKITHQDLDKVENTTRINITIFPTFDFYSLEVGDESGKYHLNISVYEIRCEHKNANMLKNLFCKFQLKVLTLDLFYRA